MPLFMPTSTPTSKPNFRQQVLVLYLANSALDTAVIAWAMYDGTGRRMHMAGDEIGRAHV